MGIDRYMELCLTHAEHGYYMKQDPFGVAGDFVTAPEICQVFGEMVGIWAITAWEKLGKPKEFAIIELGAGRGTLMKDLLRAVKIIPEFQPEIHLVEISPYLRKAQKESLAGIDVKWHDAPPKLKIPSILIANEFFDALPIKQFIDGEECKIIVQNGELAFNLAAENNNVREACPLAEEIMHFISNTYQAGLIIDYGYTENEEFDSLQALHRHKYHNILENSGDADLTAHVNFDLLTKSCQIPCNVETQREFLLRHGGDVRAKILGLERDFDRLVNPKQMGILFKVLCF